MDKLNNSINILDSQTLIYYEKLKTENKEFDNNTIYHLYKMQKKRWILEIKTNRGIKLHCFNSLFLFSL